MFEWVIGEHEVTSKVFVASLVIASVSFVVFMTRIPVLTTTGRIGMVGRCALIISAVSISVTLLIVAWQFVLFMAKPWGMK